MRARFWELERELDAYMAILLDLGAWNFQVETVQIVRIELQLNVNSDQDTDANQFGNLRFPRKSAKGGLWWHHRQRFRQ